MMMFRRLYHGTTDKSLPSIIVYGFEKGSYFNSQRDVGGFANRKVAYEGGHPIEIEVELPESALTRHILGYDWFFTNRKVKGQIISVRRLKIR